MHYDKNFAELTKDEIIAIHLDCGGGPVTTNDFIIESTLSVILRETRFCMTFNNSNNMMPALGCFALLDQVGNSYTRNDVAPYPANNGSGIKKALYYFGGFNANDAPTKALYAFRNALVHYASLRNERNGVYYRFRYNSTIPSVVLPAAHPWNGRVADLSDNTTTLINLSRLVDLVTKIVYTLKDCLKVGTLKTELSASKIVINYLLLIKS